MKLNANSINKITGFKVNPSSPINIGLPNKMKRGTEKILNTRAIPAALLVLDSGLFLSSLMSVIAFGLLKANIVISFL